MRGDVAISCAVRRPRLTALLHSVVGRNSCSFDVGERTCRNHGGFDLQLMAARPNFVALSGVEGHAKGAKLPAP
jgi:hypothetical protein